MYLTETSLFRKLLFGFGILLIAAATGWLIARGAWVPLAGALGLSLLALCPAYLWLCLFVLVVPFDNVLSLQSGASGFTLTALIGLVAMFALFASGLALSRLRLPLSPAVAWFAFLTWEACTVLWSVDKDVALGRLPTALSLFVFYLVVTSCHFSEEELSRVARFAILGGCVAAAITLIQFRSGIFYHNLNMRASLVFGDRQSEPNVFAASLQLPLSLVVGEFLGSKSWRGKFLLSVCALLIASGIFVTTSRGALLGIAVMVVVYVRKIGISWRALAAPVLLGSALLFAPGSLFTRLGQAETSGGAGRLYIWQTGLAALKDYFLTGAGLDNFSVIYNDYAAHADHFAGLNRPPHNIFLAIAVESGILGVLLFAAVIASHLRVAWRSESLLTEPARFRLIACEAAVYVMLVSSFFLHLVWTKGFWLVWIMLAICSRAPRVQSPDVAHIPDEVNVDLDAPQHRAAVVGS